MGRRLDEWFKLISIIPMLLIVGVVVIYPVIYLFYLSFTDTSNLNLIAGTARFIGLRNYVVQFGDKAFLTSIWNTLYFTVISVGASTVIGLALAWLVYSMRPMVKNVLVPLVLVPNIVAETACALMLKPMLDSSIGVLNYMLALIHIAPVSFLGDRTNAQWVIMALNVWQWVPYMFIFFLSGIDSLNISYFEVARLEGASSLRLLRSIILPLIMPIVLVAVFFRVTYSLRLFDKIYVLTGGGPGNATDTITSYIQRVGILRMDFGYSSAGGVIMLLITAVIGALTLKYLYGATNEEAGMQTLKRAFNGLLVGCYVLFALFPFLWALSISIKPKELATRYPPVLHFRPTFLAYKELFTQYHFGTYLVNSLELSILVLVVSLFVGSLAAYSFARFRVGGRSLAFGILVIQMIPPMVITFPLYLTIRAFGLLDTIPGLALAQLTYSLPFVMWVMRQFFLQVPIELEEAARLDGASNFRIFFEIIVPVSMPRPGQRGHLHLPRKLE